jgi:hypothetical protein
MRTLLIALGLAALAAPAFADTLQEVTTHGMVVSVGGQQFEVDYTADGKLTVNGGLETGTWRLDGDRLCATVGAAPENCVVYPKDKKSGDTFEVPGTRGGTATVKIK